MPVMIPVTSLGGKQFMKARTLLLPAVFDGRAFRMPSSSGGEGEHEVRFDSVEEPALYACTCRAGQTGTPCWAAARALDALTVLSVNNIYVERGGPSSPARKAGVEPAPLRASVDEGGQMALMVASATPLAGHVLGLP